MKAGDLFEVFSALAREHDERGPNASLLVLPVLIDTTENRRELFEQAAEFLGGLLLDVTSGGYATPTPAYDDSGLRAEVQTGLRVARGHHVTEVELRFEDGWVAPRLVRDGSEVTVPTPADEEVISLARALFDERLLSRELAMLLISENSFDFHMRAQVLSMLTALGQRPDLRLGAARTLVVFIQSEGLSVERHCRPRGVRYGLTDDRLIRRNPHEHMVDTVRKIVAPREPPVILFLGAGFSASSGMPIGNDLRDDAIRSICQVADDDGRSSDELALALRAYAIQPTRRWLSSEEEGLTDDEFARTLTLEQVARIQSQALEVGVPPVLSELQQLHDARLTGGDPLGAAVYALHEIIERRPRLVIITVNFDELVEHDHDDWLDVAIADDEFEGLQPILAEMRQGGSHPNCKVPLLKLHGTINQPRTCMVTEEQTRFGISPAKQGAMLELVSDGESADPVPWTYVGASMRDIDLDHIFSLPQFNMGSSERWVTPVLEESVELFVAKKHRWWSASDTVLERTVTETADTFVGELATQWPA